MLQYSGDRPTDFFSFMRQQKIYNLVGASKECEKFAHLKRYFHWRLNVIFQGGFYVKCSGCLITIVMEMLKKVPLILVPQPQVYTFDNSKDCLTPKCQLFIGSQFFQHNSNAELQITS